MFKPVSAGIEKDAIEGCITAYSRLLAAVRRRRQSVEAAPVYLTTRAGEINLDHFLLPGCASVQLNVCRTTALRIDSAELLALVEHIRKQLHRIVSDPLGAYEGRASLQHDVHLRQNL